MRQTTAIRIERHGPPEVLAERQVPLPEAGPGEVHLEVLAAGVNFADLLMRAGLYATVPPRPYSPGFEVAGVVRGLGTGVVGWALGDPAVALIRHGGYARDIVVPERNLFRYPSGLTPTQAAAIPVAFLTAAVALFESARARAGETVLVLNAAGGVGTAAVQLARWRGLRVLGTAGSAAKRAFVTERLGAEACFDSAGDWTRDVEATLGPRRLDLALDAIGGEATARCRRLLAPLGRLVFYGLSDAMPRDQRRFLPMALAWLKTPRLHPLSLIEPNLAISGIHLLHLHHREELLWPLLGEIFDAVTSGALEPIVDRTFPLDRAGAVAAHQHLHARRVIGKVVLVA
ncbi:MAG: zinc-binding dehydrogenase [Gemmatimonadetes bacterium]|nr:zinc-binding dehydrogenase [Gemmatimonadota bacterium]